MQSDGWNFADVWEWVADHFGEATAQLHADQRTTWAEMDRRADGIAATLLAAGAQHQDKVAHYLYNAPAYLESMFGLYKAGLVPVNTNYRYGDEELVYLWTNADAVAVIFHASLTERVERVRDRVPDVRTWLHVADASGVPCPDWAIDYEEAASSATTRTSAPWGRSGDDLYILYTGGTTGMPKGVMWRQDDVIASLDATSRRPLPAEPSDAALAERFTRPGPLNLPAAPLMHGTGAFNAMWNLTIAGSVVTLEARTLRRGRAARHLPARPGEVHVDRGRRVRPPDAPGSRCRAGPLGHLGPAGDRVVRRHVERREQGRAPPPQPPAAS